MSTESYSDIGQLLQRARQERRMTLVQVSREMHIRPHYLEALESGELTILPGLAYVRGYLQAYAGFLDLDKDELLRRFHQVEERMARKGFYLPQTLSSEKSPDPQVVSGGLLAALVLYLLWHLAISPHHIDISPVEPFPRPPALATIPAVAGPLPACLRELDVLYPPCTIERAGGLGSLPQQGQLHSVMELWDWQYNY